MKTSFLIFLPLLCFTSCATITRGVHEKLTVTSEPSGAEVKLSSGEKGTTPAKFVKKRRTENFTVTISKAGYASQTVKVESKGSATGGTAMAGNAIAGGIVGIAVDASTGAYNSLYPNPVSVRLLPVERSRSVTTKKRSGSVTITPRSSPGPKHTAAPTSKKSNPPTSSKPTPSAKPSPTPEELPPIKSSPPPASSPTATPYVPPVLESVPEKSPGPKS